MAITESPAWLLLWEACIYLDQGSRYVPDREQFSLSSTILRASYEALGSGYASDRAKAIVAAATLSRDIPKVGTVEGKPFQMRDITSLIHPHAEVKVLSGTVQNPLPPMAIHEMVLPRGGFHPLADGKKFESVKLERVALDRFAHELHGFPLPETTIATATSRRRQPSKKELRDWYKAHVRDNSTKRPPPSEADDWKTAKAVFPDVLRNSIRKLRREHAPAEWKRKGRRKARIDE
jgi:hypothetical protein